jgi:hypothetical protein
MYGHKDGLTVLGISVFLRKLGFHSVLDICLQGMQSLAEAPERKKALTVAA